MKNLFTATYWIASIFLIALIVVSLGYSFPEALFMASFFLPGVFLSLYIPEKIRGEESDKPFQNTVYAILGAVFAETSLLLSAHFIILLMRNGQNPQTEYFDMPELLLNPVFIMLATTSFAAAGHFLQKRLQARYPDKAENITFISDRIHITLSINEIIYIESNDTKTCVVTEDGRKYYNKTPISRWEDLLGDKFIRIHRSYLVRKNAIIEVCNDKIIIGNEPLPVSRMYKAIINHISKRLYHEQ